jgi:hypothetical protein
LAGPLAVVAIMGQRVVYVSGEFIATSLQQGKLHARSQIAVGLPPNARYVRCFDAPQYEGRIGLVFESSDWTGGFSELQELKIVIQNANI